MDVSPMRACAVCAVEDIPRCVDWPYWIDGRPAHALCAMTWFRQEIASGNRHEAATLYRLCVFAENMVTLKARRA
jgi:hypothetical protein